MNSFLKKFVLPTTLILAFATTIPVFAQDEVAEEAAQDTTMFNVIWGTSDQATFEKLINLTVWLMLFATSIAGIALIIDGIISVKAEKLMPRELADQVREALSQGDLNAALDACEACPCPMSNILVAGLNNVENGFSVVQDSVSASAEIESEKIMQRVNLLNLVASIAPMLGLMGTVLGMVFAFKALATSTGNAKATQLALFISIALYTTLYGLLTSVPVVISFTFIRNQANKLILSMEMLTYDLIKVLRDAEVVSGDEE